MNTATTSNQEESSSNSSSNPSANQENTTEQQTNSLSVQIPSSSVTSDSRIEIHSFGTDDLPRNLAGTMQQNISSLLHQARNQFERQTDTRTWRMNLANVCQGVRPLVQQAQSINNFRSWANYVPLNNENGNPSQDNSGNSITLNLDSIGESSNSQNVRNNDLAHQQSSEFRYTSNLENRSIRSVQLTELMGASASPSPSRPLLERVAALTRNDPPDLISGPSQRNNRNQNGNGGNNNQHQQEEDSVAEVFAQIPQARSFFDAFYRYIPLISILLAKAAYDHIEALTDFVVLMMLFFHSNSLVKDQISKQTQRKIWLLFREILFITAMIFFKFFSLDRANPFVCLLIITSISEAPTLSNLLYFVAATDYLLKLITVTIKILITMLPPNIIKYKGRGRYFVLIEALSQLYRSLAPVQLWFLFLLDSYSGMEKILGMIYCAAYMIAKGFDLVDRAKLCKKGIVGFFRQVNYGKIPTKDDIQIAGEQCPICHDAFNTPVKLECSHIFCELCVGTWFTREQTCPLCRAKVAEDPSWQDGSTSHFMQLY